jgi:hypothetical protein
MPWSLADKSTIPSGNIKDQRLTEREFVAKLEEVKKAQIAKRLAKEKAFEFSESSKKLDTQLG